MLCQLSLSLLHFSQRLLFPLQAQLNYLLLILFAGRLYSAFFTLQQCLFVLFLLSLNCFDARHQSHERLLLYILALLLTT